MSPFVKGRQDKKMFTPIFIIEEGIKLMGKTNTILKIVLVVILMTGCFLFGKFSSCNKTPALESIRLVKDTSDQKIVDTLKHDKEKLQDSLAVVNYQREEMANKREETRVKYKVLETYVKAQSSDFLYTQFRLWLSNNRPLTGKRYEVDSGDVVCGMLKKNENEYLRYDNQTLDETVRLVEKKVKFLERTISDDNLMLSLKDDQIRKLETQTVELPVPSHWNGLNALIHYGLVPFKEQIKSGTAGIGIKSGFNFSGFNFDLSAGLDSRLRGNDKGAGTDIFLNSELSYKFLR